MVKVYESKYKFDEMRFNKFCEKYQFMFPEEYIKYLKEYNDSELEENIIEDSEDGVYIRNFYGTSGEKHCDISTVYGWYVGRLPYKCIPIADPDFGNEICISLDDGTYGKIYFWEHDTMDIEENEKCTVFIDDLVLLANSFDELLEKIVEPTFVIKKNNIEHIRITEKIKKY